MAELDVVRKKKSPLPWILLGLLLLALVAFLIWNNTRDNTVEGAPVSDTTYNTNTDTATYRPDTATLR